MINITTFESVNFYGDPIDIAISDEGAPYVSVAQITGYLGMDIDLIARMFDNDPRVEMDLIGGIYVVPVDKLNGFLMLLPYSEVPEDLRDELHKYQVECFSVVRDYWMTGVAINRRETPHDITSKFKDERIVSRAALTKACAAYCTGTDLDPSDIFDLALSNSYKIIGVEPLHEFESLTGAEAKYLAWVESIFAKVIHKFAKFDEVYEEPVKEALVHVEDHLRETGYAWIAMADNVPASAYH